MTYDWMMDKAKRTNYLCALCFDPYLLDWNEDTRLEAVSIDRIDSEKAHSQQNCQLTHTRCNCLKQDQFILNA